MYIQDLWRLSLVNWCMYISMYVFSNNSMKLGGIGVIYDFIRSDFRFGIVYPNLFRLLPMTFSFLFFVFFHLTQFFIIMSKHYHEQTIHIQQITEYPTLGRNHFLCWMKSVSFGCKVWMHPIILREVVWCGTEYIMNFYK